MKLEIKRGKSKICIKIGGLLAYMKKKQYLCGGFFSYKRGRGFMCNPCLGIKWKL